MAKFVEFQTCDKEMVGAFESDWQFGFVSLSNITAQIWSVRKCHTTNRYDQEILSRKTVW